MAHFIHVDTTRNITCDARSKDRHAPFAVVGLRDTIQVQMDDVVLLAQNPQAQKIQELIKKPAKVARLTLPPRSYWRKQSLPSDSHVCPDNPSFSIPSVRNFR